MERAVEGRKAGATVLAEQGMSDQVYGAGEYENTNQQEPQEQERFLPGGHFPVFGGFGHSLAVISGRQSLTSGGASSSARHRVLRILHPKRAEWYPIQRLDLSS